MEFSRDRFEKLAGIAESKLYQKLPRKHILTEEAQSWYVGDIDSLFVGVLDRSNNQYTITLESPRISNIEIASSAPRLDSTPEEVENLRQSEKGTPFKNSGVTISVKSTDSSQPGWIVVDNVELIVSDWGVTESQLTNDRQKMRGRLKGKAHINA